jgi:hypothetical protein
VPSQLIYQDKIQLTNTEFMQMVIWHVEPPVNGSTHNYKYRFAYVKAGICLLRYDNEAGKGDHKHVGDKQQPITFTHLTALQRSFFNEVARLRGERE